MTEDFYDLLDIPADASQDEIQQAYREQVRVYHPDHNDDDRARAQFTALQKAYEILGDPVERKAYDRLGHEDYVAKRTKGLPSPDVWKTASDDSSSESGDDETNEDAWSTASATATGSSASNSTASSSRASSATASSSTAASTSAGSSGGATGTTGSASQTGGSGPGSKTGRSRASDAGTASEGRSSAAGTADASGVGSTAEGASTGARGATGSTHGANGSPAGAPSGAGRGSRSGGRGSPAHSRPGPLTDNPFVRWWRSQSVAWPLLCLAGLVYLLGVGQFVVANRSAVRSLSAELVAAGTDAATLRRLLTGSRHGIDTATGFLAGVEVVAAPLPTTQWYGALAGLVACSLLAVLGARIAWRRNTWGAVSVDETVVVSLAAGVSTTLVAGPLLAGAVLMPLLFGVVVRRNHALPGWAPSYLWVLAALAPTAGLAVDALGYGNLAVDVVAFGLVPIAAAVGLPIRVAIRRRYGR